MDEKKRQIKKKKLIKRYRRQKHELSLIEKQQKIRCLKLYYKQLYTSMR